MKELEQTLEELFKLNPSILIYPGHGGTTTIGAEKENSFFGF
jgi:glyoxylase-like metal-dependent hydrolase (beta-lactamase superfamily II)